MLDNLLFRTSDKLNEYQKEAYNLLAMNVVRFTPIIKNLHGYNFQAPGALSLRLETYFR